MFWDDQHINESHCRSQSADDDEGQDERPKILQADSSSTGNNHDIETETADAIEHIVVDILAAHQLGLLETAQEPLEENAEQRARQEVEAPKHRFQGVSAKIAQIHPLDPVGEQENEEIDKQHHTDLHRELVDGLGIGNLALAFIVLQLVHLGLGKLLSRK